MASIDISNVFWTVMETRQWMWFQWSGRWCVSMMVTVYHLHWYESLWAWYPGFVYGWQKCTIHGGGSETVFCSWEFPLLIGVMVLFVSVAVSMEINWRHGFQSDLPICSLRCWRKKKKHLKIWKDSSTEINLSSSCSPPREGHKKENQTALKSLYTKEILVWGLQINASHTPLYQN